LIDAGLMLQAMNLYIDAKKLYNSAIDIDNYSSAEASLRYDIVNLLLGEYVKTLKRMNQLRYITFLESSYYSEYYSALAVANYMTGNIDEAIKKKQFVSSYEEEIIKILKENRFWNDYMINIYLSIPENILTYNDIII